MEEIVDEIRMKLDDMAALAGDDEFEQLADTLALLETATCVRGEAVRLRTSGNIESAQHAERESDLILTQARERGRSIDIVANASEQT